MKKGWIVRRLFAGCMAIALIVSGMGIPVGVDAAAKTRLNKKKATIRVGATVKLKVLHKKKSVKWSSNKKKVATVSKSGLVKGKKKGIAKIIAKTGGRKYTCKVTVKAKANPSPDTDAPTSTATADAKPSVAPTGIAGASAKPSMTPTGMPGSSTSPSSAPTDAVDPATNPPLVSTNVPRVSSAPGDSTTAPSTIPTPGSGGNVTPAPAPTSGIGNTAAPNPGGPQEPMKTPGSEGNGVVSSQQVPPVSAADTLTVGNMSVTLGMTKVQVEASVGTTPDRIEKSPLGFDAYVYNPSKDYTNYLLLQFDQDKVVGMSTISGYFTYEDILTSGQQTESDLKTSGFTSMKSKYDYEAGYMYTGDNEYVLAFVDHQGSKKVYGVEILAKQTSKVNGETKLDDLFKAEKGIYDEAINNTMAKELFDFACAFRTVKGMFVFSSFDSDAAQLHSEDMAANGFVGVDSSDGTKRADRFDIAYAYRGSAECVASRSLDAFGFITWMVDNTASDCYSKLIRTADNKGIELDAYYLCAGFAANTGAKDITYAALDLFYY